MSTCVSIGKYGAVMDTFGNSGAVTGPEARLGALVTKVSRKWSQKFIMSLPPVDRVADAGDLSDQALWRWHRCHLATSCDADGVLTDAALVELDVPLAEA